MGGGGRGRSQGRRLAPRAPRRWPLGAPRILQSARSVAALRAVNPAGSVPGLASGHRWTRRGRKLDGHLHACVLLGSPEVPGALRAERLVRELVSWAPGSAAGEEMCTPL